MKLMGSILCLLLSVVILGSVLAPTISDLQTTAGAEITLTNSSNSVLREIESGDVLVCTSVYDSGSGNRTDTWTLNGDVVTSPTAAGTDWEVAIISDGLYATIYAVSNAAIGGIADMTSTTGATTYLSGAHSSIPTRTFTYTFGDSDISVVRLDSTSSDPTDLGTYAYTWGYVICPYESGEYYSASKNGAVMVSDTNDIILCGTYTTGNNDTAYYYYDSVAYAANTSYEISVNLDQSIHSGTTDILDVTVSVDVDDETFTPYRTFAPYEVTGHEASGALYSMYGLILVLSVLGVVVGFTYYIMGKHEY